MKKRGKILAFLVVFITICFSIYVNKLDYRKDNDISYNKQSELENIIIKTQNVDGEFREITPLDSKIDLYSTFYSSKILSILKKNNVIEKVPTISINSLLLYDDTFDSITNIYYFVSLYQNYIKTDDKLKIINYVIDLQNENGTFSFSPYDKKNKINDDNLLILSTYRALSILISLKLDIDLTNITNWLSSYYSNQENFKTSNLLNSGYLLNVLQISDLIQYDYQSYIKQIDLYLSEINTKLNQELKSENMNLLILYNIFELNHLFYKFNIIKSNLDFDSIINFIKLTSNQDGGFGIDTSSETNILPTFFALDILKKLNPKIDNIDQISELILLYKLESGGFSQIVNLSSNLNSTIIANNIINTLFIKSQKSNFTKKDNYLSNELRNIEDLDLFQLFVYLSTDDCENCYEFNLYSKKISEGLLKIKEIKSVSVSLYIYYAVELFNKVGTEISDEVKLHLEKIISNTTKIEEDNQLNEKILLLVMQKINVDHNSQSQINNRTLSEYIDKDVQINSILDLYFTLKNIKQLNIDIDKDYWLSILYKYQNSDGTFRFEENFESISSYFSTYYGIQCFMILNGN